MQKESWQENLKKLVNDTSAEEMMAPWLIRTTRFPNSDQYPMIHSGRVTLLGDSAHAIPPDRGLGGNNVLEEARLSSTLLAFSSKPIEWPRLIEQYEKRCLPEQESLFKNLKMQLSTSTDFVLNCEISVILSVLRSSFAYQAY